MVRRDTRTAFNARQADLLERCGRMTEDTVVLRNQEAIDFLFACSRITFEQVELAGLTRDELINAGYRQDASHGWKSES